MPEKFHANLDEPDLKVGGLTIWVHGRQFPAAQDYWDGNWLQLTARYGSARSIVWTTGPIARLDELLGFADGCESLYDTLSGIAKLDCMEPNLGVTSTSTGNEHIDTQVYITPDHIPEKHEFNELIDRTLFTKDHRAVSPDPDSAPATEAGELKLKAVIERPLSVASPPLKSRSDARRDRLMLGRRSPPDTRTPTLFRRVPAEKRDERFVRVAPYHRSRSGSESIPTAIRSSKSSSSSSDGE